MHYIARAESRAQDGHISSAHQIPGARSATGICPRLPTASQKQGSILLQVGKEGCAPGANARIEAHARRGWLSCQRANMTALTASVCGLSCCAFQADDVVLVRARSFVKLLCDAVGLTCC